MKKITIVSVFAVVASLMFIGSYALAATNVSLTPVNVNVSANQKFTVNIGVNPQGDKFYTAKIKLDFPSDLVEVKSFQLNSAWLAINMNGYDLISNKTGELIKTAGLPGGSSAATTFGTVTFIAKKDGTGSIKLGTESLVLDANNQNIIGAMPSVAISIAKAGTVAKPIETITPTNPAVTSTTSAEVTPEATSTEPTPEVTEVNQAKVPWETQGPQFASMVEAGTYLITLGTNSWFIGFVILVILAGIIWAVVKWIRRKPPLA